MKYKKRSARDFREDLFLQASSTLSSLPAFSLDGSWENEEKQLPYKLRPAAVCQVTGKGGSLIPPGEIGVPTLTPSVTCKTDPTGTHNIKKIA